MQPRPSAESSPPVFLSLRYVRGAGCKNADEVLQLLKQAQDAAENRLKVVFFAQEYFVWPSAHSVFTACRDDEHFIAQVVYIPFRSATQIVSNEEMKPYWRQGVPVVPYSMYDLVVESPDIAVFLKPYDMVPFQFTVEQIARAVPRMVFIPYSIPLFIVENDFDFIFQMPLSAASWKVVGGSLPYTELACRWGMRRGENMVEAAHPRVHAGQDGGGYRRERRSAHSDARRLVRVPHARLPRNALQTRHPRRARHPTRREGLSHGRKQLSCRRLDG